MDTKSGYGMVLPVCTGASQDVETVSCGKFKVYMVMHQRKLSKKVVDSQSGKFVEQQMVVDHICYAVKDIQEGISYWNSVFNYVQMTDTVINSLQKVKVVFMKKEGSILVKLIEPSADNSSMRNFVERGGGFHHICFRCVNLERTISDLNEKGLLTLVKPQPGEAFNNHNIAFLLGKYGMNVELIDTDEKASEIL